MKSLIPIRLLEGPEQNGSGGFTVALQVVVFHTGAQLGLPLLKEGRGWVANPGARRGG